MKKAIIFFFAIALTISSWGQNWPNVVANGRLKVSENQRFLVHENGKPFYWLGDTAWELFHRLNREEAEKYLKNRAEKGFTVIQAVALAELNGLRDPNPYFEVPLENFDPTRPREAYFQHVDWIIDKAAELGLYIALLPTWGDKVFKNNWGDGPEIFNTDNAKIYGRWLGNRYKDRKNIIWVLMGDRNPRHEADVAIWRSMAAGIEEGVGGSDKALMTAHPQPMEMEGGGAGKWFHNDKWFDFNMFQTGHCRENPIYDRIKVAYDRTPTKPTIDGEPLYEDHPVCFNRKDLGLSNTYDVRYYAYISVFAGSFGNTYGCHDVWQMYSPMRRSVNGAGIPWYEAIDLPGAGQMQFLRRLIESRPMLDRVPDQSLITDARNVNDRIQATRGRDYAFIYTMQGKEITVNMGKISGEKVVGYWYDPRTGTTKEAGSFTNKGQQKFNAPSSGYGQDWVLILDDASKNYPKP
ncbi:MAG: glycoside hydrolase family 140 protein [Runella sp.]